MRASLSRHAWEGAGAGPPRAPRAQQRPLGHCADQKHLVADAAVDLQVRSERRAAQRAPPRVPALLARAHSGVRCRAPRVRQTPRARAGAAHSWCASKPFLLVLGRAKDSSATPTRMPPAPCRDHPAPCHVCRRCAVTDIGVPGARMPGCCRPAPDHHTDGCQAVCAQPTARLGGPPAPGSRPWPAWAAHLLEVAAVERDDRPDVVALGAQLEHALRQLAAVAHRERAAGARPGRVRPRAGCSPVLVRTDTQQVAPHAARCAPRLAC